MPDISAAHKTVKPCATVYGGLSDRGIHVACLSRKSYTVTTHIYSLSEEFPTQKLFLTSL